ncbi:cysteine dioxygenase family protein [Longispora sp. NPDC051575]|uniref:cysteine dioxygenase n=1 Tax=Longispora sp. NPDC051575 TaxID=3154943 RepID=UPI003443D4A1
MSTSVLDLAELARACAADPATWPVTPRVDPDQRWYSRIAADEHHEVWLITWGPGQGTDLHDHGGAAGAFTVVAGTLTEELPAEAGPRPGAGPNGGLFTVEAHSRGATVDFGPHHVHRLTNRGTEPALSVHVYAPRLTTMTRYELDADGLRVLGVDREGEAW